MPKSQNQNQLHSITSSPSSDNHDAKRIERLFLRLAAIYGHIWKTIYKNAVFLDASKTEWQEGLQKFDNHAIKDAIMLCREKCNYPPTLPQFIEICKANQQRSTPYKPMIAEPKSAPSATGKAALAQIKAMLNMKS